MATKFVLRLGVASALLLLLAACGGPADRDLTETTPPPPADVRVSITPTQVSLGPGESQAFTATVTGANDTSVTWSTNGGTIAGSGSSITYTAPAENGAYTVTAASVAHPTASASAEVAVSSTAAPPGHEGAWAALGDGTDGAVRAMVADGAGNLYVGGSFTRAGGATVNRIARWDGSSWTALGTGIVGYGSHTSVNALALDHDGNLYAGGRFTTAGGVEAQSLAMWDGSSWTAVGESPFGLDPVVHALAVDSNGTLYAGGSWIGDLLADVRLRNIAKWDGSTWSGVGPFYGEDVFGRVNQGLEGGVSALVIDGQDNVYAGGALRTAGGDTTVNGIVMWDGENWHPLGDGVDGDPGFIRSLAVVGSNLYAGGHFTVAGRVIADNVAVWNGTEWSGLGEGIPAGSVSHRVDSLETDSTGRLYAGGTFIAHAGAPASYVATWDGSTWSPLGEGLAGPVFALSVDEADGLFAGGVFSTYDNVAKWGR